MTGALRPCGRPEWRLCNPHLRHAVPTRREETLAELLVGAAAIVVLFVLLFVIVPVMA